MVARIFEKDATYEPETALIEDGLKKEIDDYNSHK